MVKNNKGFTLVELIVAVSVFSLLSIVMGGIYLSFTKSQARTKAAQSLLNDAQYILEVLSKDFKSNEIISCSTNEIETKEENGSVKIFTYSDNTISVNTGTPVVLNNNSKFKITYLDFNCNISDDNIQPIVTIVMEVENVTLNLSEKVSYKLQTTISSRIYK